MGNTDLQLEDGGWAVNSRVTSATAQIIKAAPGDGQFLRLSELDIHMSARGTVTIESKLGSSASATVTPIIGPVSFGTSNSNFSKSFIRPIRLPANEELLARSSAVALINIYASGTVS